MQQSCMVMQLPKERKAMNHHAAKLHGYAIAKGTEGYESPCSKAA
jgi:hypothetical protein